MSGMTIAERKAALREAARARRAGLDPVSAGQALAGHVLAHFDWPAQTIIAGIWPLDGEIDLRPLVSALHALGHRIVLPETPPIGQPLLFRHWQPGCAMVRERFGTWRPEGPIAVPDVVFVPLLVFDRAGFRLGYGGGYYDRTLAGLPDATAIGAGFSAQEVEAVPVASHDRRLDAIVTEAGFVQLSPKPYTSA